MKDPKTFDSVRAIVYHFGGVADFCDLMGHTKHNVNSFIKRKVFPSRYFLHHTRILDAHNVHAPAHLWGIEDADLTEKQAGMSGNGASGRQTGQPQAGGG